MSPLSSRNIHQYYRFIYILLGVFIAGYLIYKGVVLFKESLFNAENSRINVVFYGQDTSFYSLDKKDARHYVMYFPADLKMQVPGGYGNYRLGSLGKLAKLDHNKAIYQRTFSIGTTSFVTYYFYPDSEEVYYGAQVPTEKRKPTITQLLTLNSNANFFDRLYLILSFTQKSNEDFHLIAYEEKENKLLNDILFQDESFIKKSIGLLYQTQYRDEQKSVQIRYPTSYSVAQSLGSLLEGNGIRVSDISLDLENHKACRIIENTAEVSKTAADLSQFFSCEIQKGNTDVYDIVFILGNIEKEWRVE